MSYYKVLVNGQSCHGGAHRWSLPTLADDFGEPWWQPGDWQNFSGTLALCSAGWHVTTHPSHWWKDGCSVYEAEIDGEIGGRDDAKAKVVVSRVRLLRLVRMVQLAGGWQVEQDERRSSGWGDPQRVE